MPKVSVIIPFYNKTTWVSEAIQSVLSQTYHDFEVVLIDDGSSDDIQNLINIKDSHIRYIRQENGGPASARNLGVKLAIGDYIAFLDADDLFLPEKLEIQYKRMADDPKILLSHTSYYQVTSTGEQVQVIKSGLFSGNVFPEIILECPIATPTVMVRRDVFDKFSFHESFRVGEDIILWAQIANGSLIDGIDIPLTKVRMHGANAAFDAQKQIEGIRNRLVFWVFKNKNLNLMVRNKIASDSYLSLALLSFKQAQIMKTLFYAVLSFLYLPINHKIYIQIIKYVIPKSVRSKIRSIIFK